jgi:hypothetical protein
VAKDETVEKVVESELRDSYGKYGLSQRRGRRKHHLIDHTFEWENIYLLYLPVYLDQDNMVITIERMWKCPMKMTLLTMSCSEKN